MPLKRCHVEALQEHVLEEKKFTKVTVRLPFRKLKSWIFKLMSCDNHDIFKLMSCDNHDIFKLMSCDSHDICSVSVVSLVVSLYQIGLKLEFSCSYGNTFLDIISRNSPIMCVCVCVCM